MHQVTITSYWIGYKYKKNYQTVNILGLFWKQAIEPYDVSVSAAKATPDSNTTPRTEVVVVIGVQPCCTTSCAKNQKLFDKKCLYKLI